MPMAARALGHEPKWLRTVLAEQSLFFQALNSRWVKDRLRMVRAKARSCWRTCSWVKSGRRPVISKTKLSARGLAHRRAPGRWCLADALTFLRGVRGRLVLLAI